MNKLILFSLKQRILMVVMLFMLLCAGVVGFLNLNIEAYPDPVPPLVDIVTQSTGQSAEEIERYVTIPIEVQMSGIPNVKTIRTISLFGLSDVKIQFTYDFTYEQAEQWVINRLSQLQPLPNGAQPQLSPDSPIGEIYRYRVVGPPNYSVMDLKTIEDWILERRFKAVPGVVDVTGWGGKTKSYEVAIDLERMASNGIGLQQVMQALNNANLNVGGQTVNFGPQSAIVRGVGLIRSLDDIRETMIAASNGLSVRLRDLATITVGNLPRLGIAGQDNDDDVVEGIILMRRGAQSTPTLARIKTEIEKINSSGILPPGVRVEKIYDRTDLINITTNTVLHNMVEGIILIFLVQWIFLGNLRSALIVATTIPFALFFAILIMLIRGDSANLLSVGAIDFGLIVDATVIMVENIFRHLVEAKHSRPRGNPMLYGEIPRGMRVWFTPIANAAVEVNGSIFFSAAIIIAGFVPLFTLSGVEGHIFGPMAKTYAYAIAGGLIATFTIAPALSALLLPEHVEETETFVVRWLHHIYTPAIDFALTHRGFVLGGIGAVFVLAVLGAASLGLEFLPKLEEGNLWIRASMPLSISLEEGDAPVNKMRRIIKSFPETVTAISQHGRPDDGTDATGFFNVEFYVPLKPLDEWRPGLTKEQLIAQVSNGLQNEFPGIEFNFSQTIEDNVEEAASGVKGANSIKLFGSDLETLEATAEKIKESIGKVQGITDLAVLNSLGQPTVRIDVDRKRAGRYGLTPSDVNSVVQTAIGGQSAGDLYEDGSDRHFPIMVRLAPRYRQSLSAINNILINAPAPSGNGTISVPLADVANVQLVSGAAFIYREKLERYIPIKFSVRDRDLGGAILEAQANIARDVQMPVGYRLEWAGEFGELQEALSRLIVVVPIALGLICLLLYINFGSLTDTWLAASVMPMALIGGIFALLATGTPFSVSAAIGFIALFGIAAMDGIIVLSYFNKLLDEGVERAQALRETCSVQMRPVVLTCVAACVGLLPAAFSTGIGSQVQKPLALVVVGGIILAPVLILLVMPVLIDMFSTHGRTRLSPVDPTESLAE